MADHLQTNLRDLEIRMRAICSQMGLGQAIEALEEQKSPPIIERPAAQMITKQTPMRQPHRDHEPVPNELGGKESEGQTRQESSHRQRYGVRRTPEEELKKY
jgi:hypothetical protein